MSYDPNGDMRHWVLRVVFAAPDEETARDLGTKMVRPVLGGALFEWEVQETREMLPMDEQAQGLLADEANRATDQ